MQPFDSPPSLSNSLLPSDTVLKPNATIEEKLYLLSVLVPKAENAKHRVADLHSKTLATIDSCQPLALQIREVNNYAQLFFSQMTPQLAAIDQVVSSLAAHKPKIILLTGQLRREQQQLDDFTATLGRLRRIHVHQSLKDYLLPELPPNEDTGTLADWANANELLTTHDALATDLKQMEALREWGDKQIMKVSEKHKIVVDESAASSDILAQLAKLEVESWLTELNQLRRSADSVLAECAAHATRVSAAFQAKDVLALPSFMASDLNLATQLLSINKCRSRVNTIANELGYASSQGETLVAKLQALGSETLKFAQECRDLAGEFDPMNVDIDSYMGPANADAQIGFADLQRSVAAWNEFMKVYEAIVVEIVRRRQVQQQHRMIAMRYQRELQALYDAEGMARQAFDETFQGANIPPSWTTLEFLAEPPLAFTVLPSMAESILPDLISAHSTPTSSAEASSSSTSLSDDPLAITAIPSHLHTNPTRTGTHLPREATTHPNTRATGEIIQIGEMDPTRGHHSLLDRSQNTSPPSDNSLLGSNFSLSESMLSDSNAFYQSAVDSVHPNSDPVVSALHAAHLDPSQGPHRGAPSHRR